MSRPRSCSELGKQLEQARILLHRIELDIRDTEQALKVDPRNYVREHYEWLRRKRVEVEDEVKELEQMLEVCMKRRLG